MKPALCLLALLLAGCATTGQPRLDPRIPAAFESRGVPPGIVSKVREGRPLTVDDVAECAAKGVPGPGLVSYMQSTRKAYDLSRADVARLESAGAPQPVVDYMRRSPSYHARGPRAVPQDHPYFTDDRYNLEAPFAYAPPMADTFFNSGYEEGLYSPFSPE